MTAELSLVAENIHITYRTYLDPQVDLRSRLKGGTNSAKRKHTDIKAVRGVSFDLHRGESIGIIGHNGAGKSTILLGLAGLIELNDGQVLSRSRPTLLGVGSVLNTSLSGRRNIEIGCLAMGMPRQTVTARMDELIEFSGLDEFIDLPLKAYSSGMRARLSFTVATVSEPEILLIDEALAVGDVDFRAKAAERLDEIREAAGSFILVSHNTSEITRMCERVIWLDRGKVIRDGSARKIVSLYTATMSNPALLSDLVSEEPAGIGPLVPTALDVIVASDSNRATTSTLSARQQDEAIPFQYSTPFAVELSDAREVQVFALSEMLTPRELPLRTTSGAVLRGWMIDHPSGALMMEWYSPDEARRAILLDETGSIWFPKWLDGWDETEDGYLTLDREPPRVDSTTEVVYCSSRFSTSPAHWWIDVATRAYLAVTSPELSSLQLVLPSNLTNFQRDALKILGIDESRIYAPRSDIERIDVVHYPGRTQQGARSSIQIDEAVIRAAQVAREHLIPEGPELSGRRLYISREHENTRKIRNASEVERVLAELDFETIHPDELDFASTVETFAGADLVVGVTGDGLANIVFCDPGTTVIEILPDTLATSQIWALSSLAKHKHGFLAGRAFGEGNKTPLHALDDNLRVRVDLLLKILAEAN